MSNNENKNAPAIEFYIATYLSPYAVSEDNLIKIRYSPEDELIMNTPGRWNRYKLKEKFVDLRINGLPLKSHDDSYWGIRVEKTNLKHHKIDDVNDIKVLQKPFQKKELKAGTYDVTYGMPQIVMDEPTCDYDALSIIITEKTERVELTTTVMASDMDFTSPFPIKTVSLLNLNDGEIIAGSAYVDPEDGGVIADINVGDFTGIKFECPVIRWTNVDA